MTQKLQQIMLRPLDEISSSHIEDLVELYAAERWFETRTRDDVELMLQRTSLAVAFEDCHSGRLIAFARVVTDHVYAGTLLGVIVRADVRGRGIGDLLMRSVLDHPALARLHAIGLICREHKVSFYERWGFEARSWRPALRNLGRGAYRRRRLAGQAVEYPATQLDGFRVEPVGKA